MTKQQRKYILNIVLLLAISGIAVFFVLKDDGKSIIETIQKADYRYLLLGFGIMICSYVIGGLVLVILARLYNRKYKLHQGVMNQMIGTFFSGVTPSSSGGQFVQAYTFTKQGVSVTNAASILFMNFIVHQSVAVLYGVLTIFLKFNEMVQLTQKVNIFGFEFDMITLSVIGFGINIVVLFSLFFLAFSKKIHHLIVHSGVGLLRKLRIFSPEKADRKKREIDVKVETFRIEFKRLLTNWPILILVAFLMFFSMSLGNSIPYIMGLAVHADMGGRTILDGITMTNYVNMITMMVPIPGAAGGAEFIFTYMYQNFFGGAKEIVGSINLLWRFFTFYMGVIVGALVFTFYRQSPKKEAITFDTKTMLDIEILSLTQEINFSSRYEEKEEATQRKKYKPTLIDENNIEQHFQEIKRELREQLENNAFEIAKEEKERNDDISEKHEDQL